MKILGYMQVHNEERFAPRALQSVIDVVDNMIVTLDRCTDKTKELLLRFQGKVDFQEIATETEIDNQLSEMMKNAFNDNKQYDWIFIVRGDEIYHKSIKDLKAFLSKHPLNDISQVIGYTIFVCNDVYTHYTHKESARLSHSTTLLFNNRVIEKVVECDLWGPQKLEYTTGNKITFDARNGTAVGACPTSFHMHHCTRSKVKTPRRHSPLEEKYKHYASEDQDSLYREIFEEQDDTDRD